MAITKVSPTGISSSGSIVIDSVVVQSQVKVGSATTVHTGGFLVGRSNLHSTGLEVGNVHASGILTATSFVKSGGTSSQFLKADGTTDSTTYLTAATIGGETDNVPGQIVSRNGYGGFSAGIVTATGVHINNALETVATATTYQNGSFNNVVVECDLTQGSIFTHSIGTNGTVGVVSFKDFPAIKNSVVSYTIIFTQQSTTPAGTGNTTGSTGIGTNLFLKPSGVTGFSTSAKVGSGTTVTLSSTTNDVDFVSFAIHYNGSGSGTQTNYKVYVSGNGEFRWGRVTI